MPSKKKPPLTHFLCLPLLTHSSTPQWQKSLQHLKDDLTNSVQLLPKPTASSDGNGGDGKPPLAIPPKAIRPLGTLHLTIGVMSLQAEGELNAATALLQGLDITNLLPSAPVPESASKVKTMEESVSTSPGSYSLLLSFIGLKSMHSPKSTSFLYVPPTDASGRLYPFCQALQEQFTKEGSMTEEKRELKLHATVINTIHAGKVWSKARMGKAPQGDSTARVDGTEQADDDHEEEDHNESHANIEAVVEEVEVQRESKSEPSPHLNSKRKGKRRKEVLKFDARDLLSRYADFEWATDVRIEKVAICEMGAKKILDEKGEIIGEEYKEVAFIALP
ncbi:MAG: hypothetical protein Q9218_005502 [Villophora microphyllina]